MHGSLLLLIVVVLGSVGCGTFPSKHSEAPADWVEWQVKRRESVAGTNGWTTLLARHWMDEGRTFVGTAPTNQLVLPKGRAAANIGSFVRKGRTVRFEAAEGVVATIDGAVVKDAELTTDILELPTRLMIGPLSFVVIERGERLGLRVRDSEAPARLHFSGLHCFPYDKVWRIEGRFVPFDSLRTLRVDDVIGGVQEFPSPGAVVFQRGGREHRLDVVVEPGVSDYFVIFHDETAGKSTYAAGRFLYVARPGADGRVIIDFNRSYTPPCGFTPFATCPLPPRQNWLPFSIRAGERAPKGGHHAD